MPSTFLPTCGQQDTIPSVYQETSVNCCEHTAQTSLSNPIRHQNRWREFGRYLEQNILETQQRWQPISHLIYSNLAFVQHSSENVCPLEPEFTESNSFIWLVSKRYSGAVCCLIKENRPCVFLYSVCKVWLWIDWTSPAVPNRTPNASSITSPLCISHNNPPATLSLSQRTSKHWHLPNTSRIPLVASRFRLRLYMVQRE